jgi:hypothetical protein
VYFVYYTIYASHVEPAVYLMGRASVEELDLFNEMKMLRVDPYSHLPIAGHNTNSTHEHELLPQIL